MKQQEPETHIKASNDVSKYISDNGSDTDGLPKEIHTKTNKRKAEEDMSPEDLLESKREYNRLSAARARKRQKELISGLQDRVQQITDDLNAEKKQSEGLKAKLMVLMQQNQELLGQRTLLQNEVQMMKGLSMPAAPAVAPSAMAAAAPQIDPQQIPALLELLKLLPQFRG